MESLKGIMAIFSIFITSVIKKCYSRTKFMLHSVFQSTLAKFEGNNGHFLGFYNISYYEILSSDREFSRTY